MSENFSVPCKTVMTNEDYHRHPALGSSMLKEVLRSPAHYLHSVTNPHDPTPAMQRGTLIHEALLEPDKFFSNLAVMPKFEGTGSRAAKEQWLMENHGKSIVKQEELANLYGIVQAVSKHKTARALLSGGRSELSYFWQDADTGLVCKCRPDFLRNGKIVIDIKSTVDADPMVFPKTIANFKYHLSAALYLDGVSSVEGQHYSEFVIVAVEPEPPYGVSVHLLDEGTVDLGRHLYRKALNRLKECKQKGFYPGYPDSILSTAVPPWAFQVEG